MLFKNFPLPLSFINKKGSLSSCGPSCWLKEANVWVCVWEYVCVCDRAHQRLFHSLQRAEPRTRIARSQQPLSAPIWARGSWHTHTHFLFSCIRTSTERGFNTHSQLRRTSQAPKNARYVFLPAFFLFIEISPHATFLQVKLTSFAFS